jgi:hypothetical protein
MDSFIFSSFSVVEPGNSEVRQVRSSSKLVNFAHYWEQKENTA